jgi:hypothetical protein
MRREAPEPSATFYVQPTPHGHWSSNNNFGSEVSFMPDANNRQRVIKLPEWGEPAPWTVSLGIDYSENAWPSGGSRGFEVVAEVTYGSGGATQMVLIDWIQGTSFSAPMNAISIDAIYSIPFFPHGVQPSDLTLSVLLARGSTASSIPPSKSATSLDGQLFAILDNNTVADPPARIPKFGKFLVVDARQGHDKQPFELRRVHAPSVSRRLASFWSSLPSVATVAPPPSFVRCQ